MHGARAARAGSKLGWAIALALSSLPAIAQRTLYVDGSNPNCPGSGTSQDPFCTIQLAIQTAGAGDTVRVAPGVYAENLDFLGKAIEVRGTDGPRTTRIDGRMQGSVVSFKNGEGPGSRLSGFTLENGSGTPIQSNRFGGGVFCDAASPTLTDLVFDNHAADYGGGIYGRLRASPEVKDCRFYNGTARVNGGAVFCTGLCQPVFIACLFANNSCGHVGGAVGFRGNSDPSFTNCVFVGNTAGDWGGGVRAGANSGGVFINCTFYGNSAQAGGGLAAGSDTSGRVGLVTVTNTIFWGNQAGYGAQLALNGRFPTSVDVSHCDLEGGRNAVYVQAGFPLNWPQGNIEQPPAFVDAPANDFHLTAQSPCVDTGTGSVTGLPTSDFEGDPRTAGAATDMGADEFHPHLYYTGTPAPGNSIGITTIGTPGALAFWGASETVRPVPLSIPGIQGALHLDDPILVAPLGNLPGTGALSLRIVIPASMHPWTVPTQALVGHDLTNLELVRIR